VTAANPLVAWFYGSPVYRIALAGRAPSALARPLPVRWPGDPDRGTAILSGELALAGQTIRDPAPLWQPSGATPDFVEALHGFGWLADLLAVAGAGPREAARAFVERWIEAHRRWSPLAWRGDVLGLRAVAWIAHWDELFPRENPSDPLQAAALASLARQVRHLRHQLRTAPPGLPLLAAIKGLVFLELALGSSERRIERALAALERALPAQVLPDGGTPSRSPADLCRALIHLVDIRTAIRAAQLPLPAGLQTAIDRAAPLLRFFRHGDGRLAQFNGTDEHDALPIDLVLARSEAKGRPPASAPHTGYQRLQAARTVVTMDTGAPPPPGLDGHAHAGTLSFEMSHGRERLVVNCGSHRGASAEWRRASRNTAAHSTLVVEDTNSAELRADGTLGRRPGPVACAREDDERGHWVEASHDGYASRFGLAHARRLWLASGGDDLRGEDRLTGTGGSTFAIRFHLHPSVQVSLIQDGAAALLKQPGGIGWRFRAEGAQLALADSAYLAGGEVRKTQQLVLTGPVGSQGATVLWAIRREGRKPADSSSAQE
jgi:uncharacterized heparinase superfamily protein